MSLPTLIELLADHLGGREAAIRFARAFAGLDLKMPTMDHLEVLLRRKNIAHRLSENPSTESVRAVGQFHSMPVRGVANEFKKATGQNVVQLRKEKAAPSVKPLFRTRILINTDYANGNQGARA